MTNTTNNFFNERFPTDISYGSSGGPEYNTNVMVTTSGHEYRDCKWYSSRMRFNVISGIKSEEQMKRLSTFFRACNGRYKSFRYKDWSDFKGKNETLGIGDEKRKSFQLIKNYSINGQIIEIRKITKPVKNTVKIYVDGIENSEFSIDYYNYNAGEIIFNDAPRAGAVISADFEFDTHVRFDNDFIPATIESPGFFSFSEINLIEVKE